MKCVIGLGNPGRKYEKTRHNIGFMVVDELLKQFSSNRTTKKFNCEYVIEHVANEKIMFVKPLTFMNLSGEGVKPLLNYYDIPTENVLIAYDDLDLPIGKIRLRLKGGHGGHNGIRSLITHLGTREFKRLRIGIGRPEDRTPVVNYVLQPFSKDEVSYIASAIDQSVNACEFWFQHSFTDVMNEYNK